MERRELLGRPNGRAEQHARHSDMLEGARERADDVRIADRRLGTSGLDLDAPARIARRSPDGVAGGDELAGQRAPPAPTADDQAARQRCSIPTLAWLLG
jgi:hypothetical protein